MPLHCLTQLKVRVLALGPGLHLLSGSCTGQKEVGSAGGVLDTRVGGIPVFPENSQSRTVVD